jgi:hypothetical protein
MSSSARVNNTVSTYLALLHTRRHMVQRRLFMSGRSVNWCRKCSTAVCMPKWRRQRVRAPLQPLPYAPGELQRHHPLLLPQLLQLPQPLRHLDVARFPAS